MDDWELEVQEKAPVSAQPLASGAPVPRPVPVGPVATTPDKPARGEEPPVSGTRRAKVSRWAPIAVGVLVVLLVGVLMGFYIARSQAGHTSAELAATQEELGAIKKGLASAQEVNWSYHQQNETLKAQLRAVQEGTDGGSSSSTSTTLSGSRATFMDGIYLVGKQIPPGDYNGEVTGDVGYWARLRATDGLVGSILANGLPTGPFVLTINATDQAVELRGVKLTAR